jgi:hypothetical protein
MTGIDACTSPRNMWGSSLAIFISSGYKWLSRRSLPGLPQGLRPTSILRKATE